MKKLILLLQLVSVSLFLNAQNYPPFPSVDEALNMVKTKFLVKGGSFEKEYNIKDLSKVRIQKTEDLSYFSAYASDDSYKLFPLIWPKPLDRCHVMFVLITPPESDGTYYEVNAEVVYSRIKNNVLTNKWEFYWVDASGAPTVKGGKNATPVEKINLLINTLKNIQYDSDKQTVQLTLKNGNQPYLGDMGKYYIIDSISFIKEDFTSSTTKEWHFLTKGKIYSSLFNKRSRDEIEFMNAFTQIKMVLTKTNKDWEVTGLNCYPSTTGSSEKYTQKSYSGMMCEVGFEGVLYKTTSFNPHYSNEFIKNEFYKNLYDLFLNTYQTNGSNWDKALEYFNPKNPNRNEQCENFVNYLKELNAKCVEIRYDKLKKTYEITPYVSFKSNNNREFEIGVRLYRPNCYWDDCKHYKKKYKEAGMSSAVLKSTGGMLDESIKLRFTYATIDNQLYIDTFDYEKAKSVKIPF